MNDSEAEAAETQAWLKLAVKCSYLDVERGREIYGIYNRIAPWLLDFVLRMATPQLRDKARGRKLREA